MCYACGVRGDGGSLICKSDLLQLFATACDILKRVVEQAMCDGQEKNTTGDERRECVETFASITNTIVMLLGCRDPRHWERDHEKKKKKKEKQRK
ncbi:hypothetical protein LSM04_000616 [Trypanosoma melophagium]|uniref:uncharacterized protein n=1 Tax=Trypanosoma melophagium TaxID=715481 RepID=UPI00351A6A1C|nr:hypothetical protein LSM04_000616 [Trypanosoma melophagium]